MTGARRSRRIAHALVLGWAAFLILPVGAAVAEPVDPAYPSTEETEEAPAPPTLTLQPSTGRPGDRVTVIGSEFFCNNGSRSVELVWDNGPLIADTSTDELGEFRGAVLVPQDAPLGGRTVAASCTEGPIAVTATFTVVAESTSAPATTPVQTTAPETTTPETTAPATTVVETTPPVTEPRTVDPPPPGFPIRLVVLIVTVAIAAVLTYRWWRGRPTEAPIEHVRAVTHDGPSEVLILDTPAPGQRSLAIRLQTHADSGNQTIKEVDHDHTRS